MTQQTLRQRSALQRLLVWLKTRPTPAKAPRVHCDPDLPSDDQADHLITVRKLRERGGA